MRKIWWGRIIKNPNIQICPLQESKNCVEQANLLPAHLVDFQLLSKLEGVGGIAHYFG